MGRELKRVPLDFDWPIGKTWGGYLNPFYKQSTPCPRCGGGGYSPEAKHMQDKWYGNAPFRPEERGSVPFGVDHPIIRKRAERNVESSPDYYGPGEWVIAEEAKRLANLFNGSWMHHLNDDDVAALVAAGRLHDFTSTWTPGEGWKLKDPPYIPTAKEVNEWSLMGLGHDSCNQWAVMRAECKRLGYPTECAYCKGEGQLWPSPEIKKQYEDWQETKPPKGDGFQLWETTSEGSPISPVFVTLEELCEWAATEATTFGSFKTSKEEWMKMLNDEFVCHKEGNAVFI